MRFDRMSEYDIRRASLYDFFESRNHFSVKTAVFGNNIDYQTQLSSGGDKLIVVLSPVSLASALKRDERDFDEREITRPSTEFERGSMKVKHVFCDRVDCCGFDEGEKLDCRFSCLLAVLVCARE